MFIDLLETASRTVYYQTEFFNILKLLESHYIFKLLAPFVKDSKILNRHYLS